MFAIIHTAKGFKVTTKSSREPYAVLADKTLAQREAIWLNSVVRASASIESEHDLEATSPHTGQTFSISR